MKPLLSALAIIALVCLFGPTPADAGVGLPPEAPAYAPAAPGCAQPHLQPQAVPVAPAAPGCAQPQLQPQAAPAAPARIQYTTPSTTYRTPDKTFVVPGDEYTVPGQTYDINIAPACTNCEPATQVFAPAPAYVPAPACTPYAPAVCAPNVNYAVGVTPAFNLETEPRRGFGKGPRLRPFQKVRLNRSQGSLGMVE